MTFIRFCPLLLIAFVSPGCNGTTETTRSLPKVAGKLTIGTQPVSGALVQFLPTDASGEPIAVRTSAEGTFTLMTARGEPGAVPGHYKITVSRLVGPDGKELPADTSPFSGGGKQSIPEVYTSVDQSPLMATIPADKPETTVELKLQGSLVAR